MQKRPKTGGRKPGTPNKRTDKLLQLLKKNYPGFDPVNELVRIYKTVDDIDKQIEVLKVLAPYIYPKRKSLDSDISINEKRELLELKMNVQAGNVSFSREQLLALLPETYSRSWASQCTNDKLYSIIKKDLNKVQSDVSHSQKILPQINDNSLIDEFLKFYADNEEREL